MPDVPPFPADLLDRFRAWRSARFEPNRAAFARLAREGQRPRTMVVACCDSRIEPDAMFAAGPGELFVVRNVANLVPPFDPDRHRHGVSAALEFAVDALGVAHIVVLGHAHCGGVAACHDMCAGAAPELDAPTSFIGRWMDIARPAYARVAGLDGGRPARLTALEKAATLVSLANLDSFPFVRAAVGRGALALHAAWIDIGAGALHVYDPASAAFAPVRALPDGGAATATDDAGG